MPNVLLSGPAGAGKSQKARSLLERSSGPTIAADFQSIVAALLLQERDSEGKYPLRPEWILPLTEFTRRSVITGARRAGIDIVATNSDGDPTRRAFLLSELGEDAEERIILVSEAEAQERLRNRQGVLIPACVQATDRWFRRFRTR